MGGDYWEGRVGLKAEAINSSKANWLQHSGSTHPQGQDTVSAESSFLVQRDPGPKPHSWWGLNASGNGSILSHPPPALQSRDKLVSQ